MALKTVVTRGYGNGTFNGTIKDVVLRGYEIGVSLGGTYNAVEYFTTGSSVSIALYDPETGDSVSIDTSSVGEIGSTGLFVWSSDNLTTQPTGYKEYAWVMTDGSTPKGGVLIVANLWDEVIETNGSITAQQAMSVMLAAVAGKYDHTTGEFKDPSGTDVRITGTANSQGDRSAITLTPSS